jgi:SAM-dependent methyltransferase
MFTYPKKYKFTEKWFDPMIPNWENLFKQYKTNNPPIKNVLEIGCYEGRATIFLCENVLEENVNYDIVDTFGGTLEESGMTGTAKRLGKDDFIYKNFTHNISFHPQINFNINRGFSQNILPDLVQQDKKYDFIYIDASHRADDTFVDAYYAHKMLNPGGLIIFDDFMWKDPNQPHIINSPELGIRMFFTMYDQDYQAVMQGYQIGVIKNKK